MCCEGNEKAQCITRWVMASLILVGWVFSCVTVTGCQFISFEENSDDEEPQGFGLFSFEYDTEEGRCLNYGDDYIDEISSAHKSARAFGVLAPLISGIALLGFIIVLLFWKSRIVWMVCRVLLVPSFLFQIFTFAYFGVEECVDPEEAGEDEDSRCLPGVSATMSILATFFFLVASVMSCTVPAPKYPIFLVVCHPGEERPLEPTFESESTPTSSVVPQKRVTVVNQPDGTRKTITEITNADGTKTVTETVARPQVLGEPQNIEVEA